MPEPFTERVEYASDSWTPIIEDITELCDFCVGLTEKMLSDTKEQSFTFGPGIMPGICQLCKVILRDTCITDLSVMTTAIWGTEDRWSRRICASSIGGYEFAMWANPGSAACASLSKRAPILGPHMDQVIELTKHWLRMCSNHDRCVLNDNTIMPTRVLALSQDHARPSVQLIESKGQEGVYIALSHCWGSTEKRPLRTTSSNLASYRKGIPFEDLPKTFQDCVELCQGIGVKYVWIDSLCIIQDDHQDWLSEAARMRDVYRFASVVVAASGAKDSSEGLYITDRPRSTVFQIPYRTNGEIQGTFNMMPLLGEWNPRLGPLETRAWTLQERYLSQRMLAFMPYGITWKCHGTCVDEAGRSHEVFNSDLWWFTLLHGYTTRSLTVPSDRTEAIKGIVEEIQNRRKDRYIPEFGVWEEKLVLQLLWLCDGPQFDDGKLPYIPTWSWIATKDTKNWPNDHTFPKYERIPEAEVMPKESVITPGGNLHLSGYLSTKELVTIHVRDASTVPDLELQELRELQDPSYRPSIPRLSRSHHVVTQDMHDPCHQAVLGIVRFDHFSATLCTHVCFLVKQKRRKPEDVNVEEQVIGGVVYHVEQKPNHVYWVLLLEQVGDSKFRRIDMGTLLPVAYEALQVQVQEFEII